MIKLRSLFCALFMPIAATAEQPIDMCVAPHANLDVQILACEVAAQMDTTSPAVLAYLPPIIAELRGEQGDFDTALAQIGAENAESVDLLLAMADAQFQASRLELTMIFFELALYHFPNNVSVQGERYQFLDDMRGKFGGDDTGFVELLSVGLRVSPRNPVLRNERAMLYAALGDFEDALLDWGVAIDSAVNPQLFRFRRAEGLWEFGRGREALEELEPLTVELLPGGSLDARLSDDLSNTDYYSADTKLESLQKTVNLRAEVYLLQIQIHSARPDLEAALRIANEWVDVDIQFGEPFFERAKILWAMGRGDEALEDLDSAVEVALLHENGRICPLSRFAILNRAGFYMRRDEFELAMNDFDRVLEADAPDIVQELQEHLASSRLFDGEVSGLYGPETRSAFLTCIRRGMCDP